MQNKFFSFLQALKEEANKTRTENLAMTWRSSGSENVDLFSSIGALRSASDEEIVRRFIKAWAEDHDLAMKILFYARDIRGGLGERRVFRVILNALASLAPESVCKNIPLIPEYGRYDDLLELLGTPCEADALSYIREQMAADIAKMDAGEPVSLLAKWLQKLLPGLWRWTLQNTAKHSAPSAPRSRSLRTICGKRITLSIIRSSRPKPCSNTVRLLTGMTLSATAIS